MIYGVVAIRFLQASIPRKVGDELRHSRVKADHVEHAGVVRVGVIVRSADLLMTV